MSAAGRVLITGAGGFIGRWSVAPLLRAGYEVHAVLSHRYDRPVPKELKGANIRSANLLNEAHIEEMIERVLPTHLLHFAWVATPGEYWQSEENESWLASSGYLLECFRMAGGVRAVLAGTCAEYDWSRAQICDEATTPLADSEGPPATRYARCKLELQRELAAFSQSSGMSSAWGRIFFQFGPDEHPDRLVPSIIRNLLRNREALCSHGRQVRSFMHVADVGAAFASVLDSDVQGPVNIGSDEQISVGELAQQIGAQMGRPQLIKLGARPSAPGEPPLLVPHVKRLRSLVGFRPQFDLQRGLEDAISWWRIRGMR